MVLDRIGEPQRWVGDPVHGWWFEPDEMPDLEAKLSVEGINVSVGGELSPWKDKVVPMTIRMTHLANDVLRRRGWKVMGYESFEAYCEAVLPFTLPKNIRKDVVLTAIADGMSVRAAAAVARTSKDTARRDAAETAATVSFAPVGATGTGRDGREYTRTPDRGDGSLDKVIKGKVMKNDRVVQMHPPQAPVEVDVPHEEVVEDYPPPSPPPSADGPIQEAISALEEGAWVSEPLRLRLLRLLDLVGQRNDISYTT
jgi:hypothetical protein